MERGLLHTGEMYHVYNRGVDKRTIFTDRDGYSYFIHLLYTLNDSAKSPNRRRDYLYKYLQSYDEGSTFIINEKEKLVDILAFALMPNHYHLLLKQRVDDGVSKFMQKVGTGYTMLFNEKHNRSGSLFQGRYKSVHISSDRQLLYIPHYIHLNPLSLCKQNIDSFEYLKNYKWSSFQDYIGINNYPSVISKKDILDVFGDSNKYLEDIKGIISDKTYFQQYPKSDFIDL